MMSVACCIALFVLITVKYNSVYVQCADSNVENRHLGGVSTLNGRNISSHDDGHAMESFDDDVSPLDLSMISAIFSDILDAPVLKIINRVNELHRTHTEQIDIVSAVLSSAEMKQLIDNWFTRSDVRHDVITTVQTLISSPELITAIDVLTYNNITTAPERLCTMHNLTKLPEFRKIFSMLTSLDANTIVSRLPDMFKWNKTGFVNPIFSPAIDAFLDMYCELASRMNIQNTNSDISDTTSQPDDDNNDHPITRTKALSDVDLSTDELLDQLQAPLNAPELAEIGNINSTLNIDQFINQLQAAVSSGNLAQLLQIFSQLQNGSLDNETVTVQELITDLMKEVNDSWGKVQLFVRKFIEKSIRETLEENGVSASCQDSSFVFVQALLAGETWTYQIVNSMGKLPRDISASGTLWLGNFDECTAASSSSIDEYEPFHGKYCRATIPTPGLSPAYGSKLTLGTCVPSTCSARDTVGLLLTVQKLFLNGSAPILPTVNYVEDRVFGTDAVIVTCILVIIGFIVVFGTLYDIVFIQSKSSKTGSKDSTSGTCDGSFLTSSSPNHTDCLYKPIKADLRTSPTFTNTGDGELGKQSIQRSEHEIKENRSVAVEPESVALNIPESIEDKDKRCCKGVLQSIMLSFSAYTNGVKVLSTEQPSGAFTAIYGIRFFSMAWIIFGHTFYFGRGYHDNPATQYDDSANHWAFSIVMYATPSVDSFFAISGILVGYLTLKQLEKVGEAKNMNWFLFYFHRFWRLTPSYMLILMTATVLLPYVTTGPMWEEDFPGTQGCRKYWWTNLLYINNFVNVYPDISNMCAIWTWYLANDMQFYILSPLIVLPLFYNVMVGIVSCVVFLVATITTTAILSHKYEYPGQMTNYAYAPTPKDEYSSQRIYFPCYTRMGPYIIGLLTGYLLYRLKSTCRIPKAVNLLCWFVCLAICCLCVFGPYSYKDEHIFTQLQSDLFLALHRTGWGVAICWIVFACATGNGGWINELLSWRLFIPLGRLTYMAYLVHPIVMYIFYASRRFPANFTDYVLYLFVGHVVLSYGAAFITCLMFESPMIGLEKVIFDNRRK